MEAQPAAGTPIARPLTTTRTPFDVLRRLRDDALPFLLVGDWVPGSSIAGSEPIAVHGGPGVDHFAILDQTPPVAPPHAGFVGGGWFGYLGYELAHDVEVFPTGPGPRGPMGPAGWLAHYDNVLRLDLGSGQWWFEALATPGRSDAIEDRFEDVVRRLGGRPEDLARSYACGGYRSAPTGLDHTEAVRRAIDYIRGGDIFQANICLTLEAPFSGDPLDFFCAGAERLEPAYGAFFRTPDGAVSSFSPELFLRRTGSTLLSSPIKGTAVRPEASPLDAERQRHVLVGSAKDRAENVMIVDLMRNDISRVATPGSVRVPALLRAEPHPGVWHLVSDVVGECRPGVGDGDVLRATFPPGSVTGAPKVRALEIISELECTPRGVYTGAVGFQSPCAGLVLNVAIRTFEFLPGVVRLGVGSGIVADSDPDLELEECLVKARPLIKATGGSLAGATTSTSETDRQRARAPLPAAGLVETMRVVDGRVPWLADHLDRLRASALAVHGLVAPDLEDVVAIGLRGAAAGVARLRLRLRLSSGQLVATTDLREVSGPAELRLRLAVTSVPLGAHKWHDRRLLELLGEDLEGDEDGLLLADDEGAVLEADTGNVFAWAEGVLRTPALDGRILPGVARRRVLAAALALGIDVREGRLALDELAGADEVFVSNALRGVRSVRRCRGLGAWEAGPVAREVQGMLESSWRAPAPVTRGRAGSGGATATRPRPPMPGGWLHDGRPRVVVIDNYDSFTYNLVHYLDLCGGAPVVLRNDVSVADVEALRPTAVVISPGPCSPTEAGVSNEVVRQLGPWTPILGVCLGHECIGAVYGGRVVIAGAPMHGKTSRIEHDGSGLFHGLPQGFEATRYHSLVLAPDDLPDVLQVTARTVDGVIMAVRHIEHPVYGVQFHPESCMTQGGLEMVANFLTIAGVHRDSVMPIRATSPNDFSRM